MSAGALIWVQHLLGSGHLRRALALAEALARAGLDTTLASGGPPMPWPAPPGVDMIQLPALRAEDGRFAGLVDEAGRLADEALWQRRGTLLRRLVTERRPAVLVTEMFPFGRRAFRHEVTALLDHAGELRPRPLTVASVRDVLVAKSKPERWLEMRDIALERYDLVLVHGDPRLFDFARTFPHADAIADRLIHTGFVLSARPSPIATARGSVVVSAGGGAVGARLIETALAARPLTTLVDRPWRLIAGANLPAEERSRLAAMLPSGVALERHLDELPGLMAAAAVSVSQAGYNTVAEGLAGAARMVLVPFDAEGQDEQRARAARLAELGLVVVVAADALNPRSLASAIDRAAARPRPHTRSLAFDGAKRSAAAILARLDDHVP
jgi:predicted glycosyltransferase